MNEQQHIEEMKMEMEMELDHMMHEQMQGKLEELVLKAGFKADTPMAKVKKIILGHKWKPTTTKTKIASQQLFDYFLQEETDRDIEEQRFVSLCRDWGYYYGLTQSPVVSSEEKKMFKDEVNRYEQTIAEKFGVDVRKWGNPLEYQVQEN